MPFKEHNAPFPAAGRSIPDVGLCQIPQVTHPPSLSPSLPVLFSDRSTPVLPKSLFFILSVCLYVFGGSCSYWFFFLFNDVTLSVPRYIGLIVTMVYLVRLYEEGECQRLTMPVQCDCITSQAQTPFFKFSRFSK